MNQSKLYTNGAKTFSAIGVTCYMCTLQLSDTVFSYHILNLLCYIAILFCT